MMLIRGLVIALLLGSAAAAAAEPLRWADAEKALAEHRAALERLRSDHASMRHLPDAPFFLFGMGARRKLLYRAGTLSDARTGEVLGRWDVARELIVPPRAAVLLETRGRGTVAIEEDERSVRLTEGGRVRTLTEAPVKLPTFAGHRWAPLLATLHQEILVNVVDGAPVPNLFVYDKPWYRDATVVAMVLERTGNLPLIRDWVARLGDPFDHNNGVDEADNPGEVLVLLGKTGQRNHPLVPKLVEALRSFDQASPVRHVRGRTDGAFHVAYQTLWAKQGLAAVGLPDPYEVPTAQPDSYGLLVWWDKRAKVPADPTFNAFDVIHYPYLAWAEDHHRGTRRAPVGNRDYPLTWESRASKANYEGMRRISDAYTREQLAAPHTWHAAEMFLLLLEDDQPAKR